MDHVTEMRAEQAPEFLRGYTLADALAPAHDDSDLAGAAGVLNRIGHPVEQIFVMPRVAVADIVVQMCEIKLAIARNRLAADACPKIEHATRRLAGSVDNAIVLPALGMINPPLANADLA